MFFTYEIVLLLSIDEILLNLAQQLTTRQIYKDSSSHL